VDYILNLERRKEGETMEKIKEIIIIVLLLATFFVPTKIWEGLTNEEKDIALLGAILQFVSKNPSCKTVSFEVYQEEDGVYAEIECTEKEI